MFKKLSKTDPGIEHHPVDIKTMAQTQTQLFLEKTSHKPHNTALAFGIMRRILHAGRLPLHVHQANSRRLNGDRPSTLCAKAINVVEHVSALLEGGCHHGGLHAVDRDTKTQRLLERRQAP